MNATFIGVFDTRLDAYVVNIDQGDVDHLVCVVHSDAGHEMTFPPSADMVHDTFPVRFAERTTGCTADNACSVPTGGFQEWEIAENLLTEEGFEWQVDPDFFQSCPEIEEAHRR